MRVRVAYQSTTGNTKRVAETIARAVGYVAEPVDTATVD
jgi:flavodoxin